MEDTIITNDVIDFVTISTQGNATDFGDALTEATWWTYHQELEEFLMEDPGGSDNIEFVTFFINRKCNGFW